ncbi:hypothetical protein FGB62_242g014 [Gracilaria domingensis]|nr:hypothetical protein FGB62_242g014 [Gracilaria domingensis]
MGKRRNQEIQGQRENLRGGSTRRQQAMADNSFSALRNVMAFRGALEQLMKRQLLQLLPRQTETDFSHEIGHCRTSSHQSADGARDENLRRAEGHTRRGNRRGNRTVAGPDCSVAAPVAIRYSTKRSLWSSIVEVLIERPIASLTSAPSPFPAT